MFSRKNGYVTYEMQCVCIPTLKANFPQFQNRSSLPSLPDITDLAHLSTKSYIKTMFLILCT